MTCIGVLASLDEFINIRILFRFMLHIFNSIEFKLLPGICDNFLLPLPFIRYFLQLAFPQIHMKP